MQEYWHAGIWLRFFVDFLLLMGANRLCSYPPKPGRAVLAALLGGIYGVACLMPGFRFLGNLFWSMVRYFLMSLTAFGLSASAIRRGVVFLLLSMALGGLASVMGGGSHWSTILSAAMVFVLCAVGFRGRIGGSNHVPVELSYGGKHVQLTALQDTGNTLRDPITGRPVLVVGADTAEIFTGLSPKQLRQPVETMGALPGLQLIPYKTVGVESGFLLALRFPSVRIGSWKGSGLVAFAPEVLSKEGAYQALTGGV